MIEDVADASPANLARFEAIIDVRTPAEFAEDHVPGATNLPVLSDEERAVVGTIYVQDSRYRARRIGAAYVARNIAQHLQTTLSDKPADFHPLVYCWRGGMRSNAMATVFSQVGWRTGVLNGGYRTWRREVAKALRDDPDPAPWKIIILDGQTGAAKTEILARLSRVGVQSLDLEDYAAHRGSVFGGFAARPQPSQKMFESLIWQALRGLDPQQPIVVEAESSRIGRCEVPPRLWQAMLGAPRITVKGDLKARARYLTTAYADIIEDKHAIETAIVRLSPFHAKEQIEDWRRMANVGAYVGLAESLMREHYDPLYNRTRLRRDGVTLAEIALENLTDSALYATAKKIKALLESTV